MIILNAKVCFIEIFPLFIVTKKMNIGGPILCGVFWLDKISGFWSF
jgi:hypothetical protein